MKHFSIQRGLAALALSSSLCLPACAPQRIPEVHRDGNGNFWLKSEPLPADARVRPDVIVTEDGHRFVSADSFDKLKLPGGPMRPLNAFYAFGTTYVPADISCGTWPSQSAPYH